MASNHPPYDVTTVPTEIWQDIIVRACTDGGYTGRSLISTSKFFHAQAYDSQFTSLALFSLSHVELFLAFVHSRPSNWRYPVRHLWLSLTNERKRKSTPPTNDDDNSSSGWRMRFDRAMSDLLSLVAPSLRTLTLLQTDSPPFPWSHHDFPVLKELTVWGDVPDPLSTHPPRLPVLQRFHLVICRRSNGHLNLLAPTSWLYGSPITHLRLSDVSVQDEEIGFAHALAGALGVPSPRLPGGSEHTRPLEVENSDRHGPVPAQDVGGTILPHLRYLWIHGIECMIASCIEEDHDPEVRWDELVCMLQEVVEAARQERGVWGLVMVRSWRKGTVWERRLWDDWLDRMEGRQGCWVESRDEEEALEGVDVVRPYEGGMIWD